MSNVSFLVVQNNTVLAVHHNASYDLMKSVSDSGLDVIEVTDGALEDLLNTPIDGCYFVD